MKWENDLTRDIRFGDRRDISEAYSRFHKSYLPFYHVVDETSNGGSFSECNQRAIEKMMDMMGKSCQCIVEIGVDRRTKGIKRTSTETILRKKSSTAIYLGVDILDKSYLNNEEKNIYTIQTQSENTRKVIKRLNDLNRKEIDFLFIDGFHSVEQVYSDWELTSILSKGGVVGFHDTAYHPGPHLFVNNIDKLRWNVIPNCCDNTRDDYGIGFLWKK